VYVPDLPLYGNTAKVGLGLFQVYANFSPPPATPESMGMIALSFYAVPALLAGLVERFAIAPAGSYPTRSL
jgi:hypothetical protein